MAKKTKFNIKDNPNAPEYTHKVPVGFAWIYNRLPSDFALTFDGKEEAWEPHEFRMCHQDLAKYCERRGIHKWDPLGARTVMALVDSRHKFFGYPLPQKDVDKGNEILVRNKGLDAPASEVTEVEVPD